MTEEEALYVVGREVPRKESTNDSRQLGRVEPVHKSVVREDEAPKDISGLGEAKRMRVGPRRVVWVEGWLSVRELKRILRVLSCTASCWGQDLVS